MPHVRPGISDLHRVSPLAPLSPRSRPTHKILSCKLLCVLSRSLKPAICWLVCSFLARAVVPWSSLGRNGGAGINTRPASAIAAIVLRPANALPTLPGNSLGTVPWEFPGSVGRFPRWSLFSCWFTCFMKGVSIMTLVPLNECCLRLGVDPKTLRLWRNRRPALLLSASHRCSSQMPYSLTASAIGPTAWSPSLGDCALHRSPNRCRASFRSYH